MALLLRVEPLRLTKAYPADALACELDPDDSARRVSLPDVMRLLGCAPIHTSEKSALLRLVPGDYYGEVRS